MAEAQLAHFQETQGISFHDAMLRADEVPFGPKVRDAVKQLGELLLRATRMAIGGGPTDISYDPLTGEITQPEALPSQAINGCAGSCGGDGADASGEHQDEQKEAA